MDEDDDGGFGLDFRVDDEGLDGAAVVLEGDVLVVAGRGFEAGFGPVLSLQDWRRREGAAEGRGASWLGAWGEFSPKDAAGTRVGEDFYIWQWVCILRSKRDSMKKMVGGMLLLLMVGVMRVRAQIAETDSDRDGLSDVREQALLERFVPRFQVSKTDCAVKPALFAEDVLEPTVVERDGTIYGQVTPREGAKGGDAVVEVHYYDLWSVDCGRRGHPLDAEHVSVLLRAKRMDSPPEDWTAVYWFAAAHEATVCDASQVASAKVLDAERQGATVWLSAGKHGAFLSEAICSQGCGGDRCIEMSLLVEARVVNLGEPGAAMHGAIWARSSAWPLAVKMQSDFSASAIARLEQGGGVPVEMNGAHGSVKGTIYVANSVANGIGTSGTNTGDALNKAGANTGAALDNADAKTEGTLAKGAKATGGALKKSAEAVGRFLHLSGDELPGRGEAR